MQYQKTRRFFAQIAGSIEHVAIEELRRLGAEVQREVPRGAYFTCDNPTLYRIIYTARLTQRVLAPIISLDCHSEKYLYDQARNNIDWPAIFTLDESFCILSNVSDSNIHHSLYAGQVLKDAICDRFRDQTGARPNFAQRNADVTFSLHIAKNHAVISLDVAGKSMHKRGYRDTGGAAPLQETLAAALLVHTKWNGDRPLTDIMCGSGVILAEALMLAANIPAGYLRGDTGLTHMPDYDADVWNHVRETENARMIAPAPGLICGSDINAYQIKAARGNLNQLPFGKQVALKVSRFQDLPALPNRFIVTNPPYGVRMGEKETVARLYMELGDFLRRACPDSEAYILCGDEQLSKALHLRATWKKKLKNGDLDTLLVKTVNKRKPERPAEDVPGTDSGE